MGPLRLRQLLVGLVQKLLEIGRHEVRPLGRAIIPLQVLHCRERPQSRWRERSSQAGASGDRVGRGLRSLRGLGSKTHWDGRGADYLGLGNGTEAQSPHSQARKPHMHPLHPQSTGRKHGGLPRRKLASLLLYASYSSTSARFPSSALSFNRMSLSSGDMK